MSLEPLRPDNTTVILIDFAIGFGNLVRSQAVDANVRNAALLADIAKTFGSGLVVTNGPSKKASGPYYPQVLKVLGDHPVIERGGMFDAFLFDAFRQAVADTRRANLVIGGLMTDGCVLQTVLGALRAGYTTYVMTDACGAVTRDAHDASIERMTLCGAIPITALALAAEFTVDQDRPEGQKLYRLFGDYAPPLAMESQLWEAGREVGQEELK